MWIKHAKLLNIFLEVKDVGIFYQSEVVQEPRASSYLADGLWLDIYESKNMIYIEYGHGSFNVVISCLEKHNIEFKPSRKCVPDNLLVVLVPGSTVL